MARLSRHLALLDIVLVGVLLVLLYFFIHRLGYTSRAAGNLTESDVSTLSTTGLRGDQGIQANQIQDTKLKALLPVFRDTKPVAKEHEPVARTDAVGRDEEVRNEINARLRKIPDNRNTACAGKHYSHLVLATIIIDFFDYQLYDLKVTVGSVLLYSTPDLLKEIIIVDDGSTLDHLIKESQAYVAGIPKAVLVRNEERQGRLGARLRGAREANGHNLLFLDTSAIVSAGWLEPLINVLQEKTSVVAQPRFDKISDPVTYEYVPLKETMVATMSWSLTVRMGKGHASPDPEATEHVQSPMIHGAAFAVTKEYFEELGKLDASIGESGGENVELSLRTWFCGGEIVVVPCSRVGVLNIMDPIKINSFPAVWYITEIWLKSYKAVITSYFDHDLEKNVDTARRSSMVQRLNTVTDMKCSHDINWFVENVAKDMFAPSPDATMFGYLKTGTGNCARLGKDSRLDLGHCRPADHKLLPGEMSFEFMKDGTLRLKDKCIQCMDNAYAMAQPCLGKDELRQYWDVKDGGIFVNRWSHYCLMHVTEPDSTFKDEHRQILMAQPCDLDKTAKKEFSMFQFVKA